MIHDSTRGANDDVWPARKSDGLRHHVNAADENSTAHTDAGAQCLQQVSGNDSYMTVSHSPQTARQSVWRALW